MGNYFINIDENLEEWPPHISINIEISIKKGLKIRCKTIFSKFETNLIIQTASLIWKVAEPRSLFYIFEGLFTPSNYIISPY